MATSAVDAIQWDAMNKAQAIFIGTVLRLGLDGASTIAVCAALIAMTTTGMTKVERDEVLAKLIELIHVHPSIAAYPCPGPAGLWPCSHPDGFGHAGDHVPTKKEDKPNG